MRDPALRTCLQLSGWRFVIERPASALDTVPLEARALNTDTSGDGVFRGMRNGLLRFTANSGGGQPKWEAFTKVTPGGSKPLLTKAHPANMPLKPIGDLIANQTPGWVSPSKRKTSPED